MVCITRIHVYRSYQRRKGQACPSRHDRSPLYDKQQAADAKWIEFKFGTRRPMLLDCSPRCGTLLDISFPPITRPCRRATTHGLPAYGYYRTNVVVAGVVISRSSHCKSVITRRGATSGSLGNAQIHGVSVRCVRIVIRTNDDWSRQEYGCDST